jgi:hypothetical protein
MVGKWVLWGFQFVLCCVIAMVWGVVAEVAAIALMASEAGLQIFYGRPRV